MFKPFFIKKIKHTDIHILLVIIFMSCLSIIIINFYTIKILSSCRAYVNGESHYSKGQKDAIRHLITYLYTENNAQWQLYKTELNVPIGDGNARRALINNQKIEIIKDGFRAGRNHEEDLDDLIWLFINFKDVSFFKKAINEWNQADILINQTNAIGLEIKRKIKKSNLSPDEQRNILSSLSDISDKLTVRERNFSNLLGEGTRIIKFYLTLVNIFFVLIIFSCVSLYYLKMIRRILLSKQKIKENNQQLQSTIKDLEQTKEDLSKEIFQQKKIIGTISHDIKSPLKYIVLIGNYLCAETQKDSSSISHKYASSILKSSSQLYEFTKVLVEYSNIYIEDKNHKKRNYSFYYLAHKKVELFKEIANSKNIIIINNIDKKMLCHTNINIISIIIHNLLDNAIKNTNDGQIEINATTDDEKLIFSIKDSGVGMDSNLIEYYTNRFKNKESEKLILNNFGVGLHFVLELLIILKGNITFSSGDKKGTLVTIEVNH
ncbi:sensor histidine kinase [Flavobacterium sp. WC2509]|uniref:sensor histidine kinase n=1 Tax=Flavobacterium sp. WC2509 TaxID=3461406 RepID=UPI00404424D6